jgi:hypothetical protein
MRALLAAAAILLAACSPSGGKPEEAAAAVPAVSPFKPGTALVFPEDRALELLNQCSRGIPDPVSGTWTPSDSAVAELESRLVPWLRQQRPATYPEGATPDLVRTYAGLVMKGRRVIYLDAEILSPNDPVPPRENVLPDRPFNGVCDGGPRFFGLQYDVEAKTFSNLLENGPY